LTIDQREKIRSAKRIMESLGIQGCFFLTYYDDFVSVYAASLAMDELDKIVSGHF